MKISISTALTELGISAIVKDNEYETIQWFCKESEIPSKQTVENKVAELQKAEDALQYQRDRAVAYDPIPEQLDQIYHDIDGWKKRIKSVKDKYPKPT
tara:strand:+ start:439 stop:732 length:294 start_codon:yes stop_codon:yes gene_type:complete